MPTIDFKLGGTLIIKTEPDSGAGAFITLQYDRFTITAKGDQMSYVLPNDKQVRVKVSYVDAKGNPAQVDGPVSWGSSDSNIIAVVADTGDPMQAIVTPSGSLGQAQVTVTADVDLGAGVQNLITTMDVQVVAGTAVAGTIEPVGEATPIPPA